MNDEDRALIRELIKAISGLTGAIQNMPRSITYYPADYRPPGGYGAAGGGLSFPTIGGAGNAGGTGGGGRS